MRLLPNSISSDDTICFSIRVTSRCNLKCSYCNYKSLITPDIEFKDIDDEVFNKYLDIIEWVNLHITPKIQIRFSGGEPLLLGKRMFDLVNKVTSRIGKKVHILTNGALLDCDAINLGKQAGIAAFLVSLENPYDIDPGSISPAKIIDKILLLKGQDVKVLPAVVILRNHMFSQMAEVADYFYSRLGNIPTISELNFGGYVSPTSNEILTLRSSVEIVVQKYLGITPLRLFPYIVPELAYTYKPTYLVEFGVAPDRFNFTEDSITKRIHEFYRYVDIAYPPFDCYDKQCQWSDGCKRIKWFWKDKENDYCKLKKAICDGYYHGCLHWLDNGGGLCC